MTAPDLGFFHEATPSVLPVLSAVIPDSQIPQALRAALDSRQLEKASLMAMAEELVHELRSEVARLAPEMVQSSIRQVLLKRSRMDL